MRTLFIIIISLLFFTYDSLSQEILVGVSENTTLKSAETGPNYAHKSNKLTDTLSLPFSDDFSDGNVSAG